MNSAFSTSQQGRKNRGKKKKKNLTHFQMLFAANHNLLGNVTGYNWSQNSITDLPFCADRPEGLGTRQSIFSPCPVRAGWLTNNDT